MGGRVHPGDPLLPAWYAVAYNTLRRHLEDTDSPNYLVFLALKAEWSNMQLQWQNSRVPFASRAEMLTVFYQLVVLDPQYAAVVHPNAEYRRRKFEELFSTIPEDAAPPPRCSVCRVFEFSPDAAPGFGMFGLSACAGCAKKSPGALERTTSVNIWGGRPVPLETLITSPCNSQQTS